MENDSDEEDYDPNKDESSEPDSQARPFSPRDCIVCPGSEHRTGASPQWSDPVFTARMRTCRLSRGGRSDLMERTAQRSPRKVCCDAGFAVKGCLSPRRSHVLQKTRIPSQPGAGCGKPPHRGGRPPSRTPMTSSSDRPNAVRPSESRILWSG